MPHHSNDQSLLTLGSGPVCLDRRTSVSGLRTAAAGVLQPQRVRGAPHGTDSRLCRMLL